MEYPLPCIGVRVSGFQMLSFSLNRSAGDYFEELTEHRVAKNR